MQFLQPTHRKHVALSCVALLFTVGLAVTWSSQTDAAGNGPDVTVIYLPSVANYTSGGAVNGMRAYALGTTSCNIGNEPLWWCDNAIPGVCDDDQHPVIAQNLYRLKDGSFRQIGMSWLKHGFLSLNTPDSSCIDGVSCQTPPEGGDQLGVGCTDAYGAGLNGNRPLGLRSEVNAATGVFPYPETSIGSSTSVDQRIQVLDTDLDPALNPEALYWMEGHYIAPDDAESRNGFNNASYREVLVTGGSQRNLSTTGPTVREVPAVYAWQAVDPSVDIVTHDPQAGERLERYHIARKITYPASQTWHYEYVVHNLSSDRSARRFSVDFPETTNITNAGFHDVDHHSGEPYDATDWEITINNATGTITWETDTFADNPDANALRWGTAFTFWFDADASASGMSHELEGFKDSITEGVKFSNTVFADSFESGDTSAWSTTTLR